MAPAARIKLPLCIDCDGTLIQTDLLHESVLLMFKRSLASLWRLPLWLINGKAALKNKIAENVSPDFGTLPYNQEVLSIIRGARDDGRVTVLVTAAPREYAEGIARHVQLFDQVFFTGDHVNLAGAAKAARLVEVFGRGNFVYAGNSRADLPVWASSGGAIVVSSSKRLEKAAARTTPVLQIIRVDRPSMKTWIRAIRVHQWLKNSLVFVPALAAHQIANAQTMANSLIAFFAFSFCSSAVYVINDLLDLTADRLHPRKRNRPFASGALSVAAGLSVVPMLLALALAFSMLLPFPFIGVLLGYFVSTCIYSFWLKEQVMVDVMLLASLYTSRILAGAAATAIVPSFWLLAFSMFVFLALALIKRYSELVLWRTEEKQHIVGRGYTAGDSPVLLSLGAAAGYTAVLILALYINSADVEGLYPNRWALWLILPPFLYWVSRIWLKAHRGEMHEDPVVFAVTDRQSWLVAACMAGVMWIAALR